MTVYLVTAKYGYREHPVGALFEATLAPDVEARALKYGAVRIVERSVPRIRPDRWRLPDGWNTPNLEAPQGASSVNGASK